MIHRLLAIVACILFTTSLTACDNFSADAQAVRDSWKKYQDACNAHDGKAAVLLLSAASVARYDTIKKLALDADEMQIRRLSLWDQLELFIMRAGLSRAELVKMDAPTYCIYAVDQGWWEDDGEPTPLGSIKLRKDIATATDHDQLGKWVIEFVREDGQWKVDEPASDRFFGSRIERIATKQHMAETDVIFFIVEKIVGEIDQRTIWKPMR